MSFYSKIAWGEESPVGPVRVQQGCVRTFVSDAGTRKEPYAASGLLRQIRIAVGESASSSATVPGFQKFEACLRASQLKGHVVTDHHDIRDDEDIFILRFAV